MENKTLKYKYKIKSSFGNGNSVVFKTLCDLNDEHPEATEIIVDLNEFREANPFNMLLISRKLFRFREKYPNKVFSFVRESVNDYLGHMGFYNAMGSQGHGKRMGEAFGSNTYIPITEIDLQKDFYGNIENTASKLANVLQFDKNLADFIKYAFVETIRNVFEHSQSEKAYVCAQKWTSQSLVEIAVLDEGCGIAKAMERYSKGKNEEELLKLSIQPGVSAKTNHSYLERDNEWRNSGYGLFVLRELCNHYDGSFTLCSNNYAIACYRDGSVKTFHTSFNGTCVCLRFKTDKEINFVTLRKTIVKKGESIAKDKDNTIKKASKSSGGNYGTTSVKSYKENK